ncbi:prolyl oligopeptidase family serine peptidase [Colwelliaceae bacterium 6441]
MTKDTISEEELHRVNYVSNNDQTERSYFVYLPKGYHSQSEKKWPVMLFLHGNGERGNGKDELDYVLTHGPLYEAWIQKKDLPFIIISPQLHMFDFDQQGIGYIDNRQLSQIPQRMLNGVPPRSAPYISEKKITRNASINDMADVPPLLPLGWEQVETDLMAMLANVSNKYRVEPSKTYLTGLSYGGFGTWFLASQYPEKFAAIAPVVGWGHPSLMDPVAQHKIPVWQFAGGRDSSVEIAYFYAGIERLRELGHTNVRLTIHEELEHDAWKRVYSSDDFYQWLLKHAKYSANDDE